MTNPHDIKESHTMKEFKNKVAVVTGGASGIGYAFAERAVQEGMKVVIADIREDGLARAKAKLEALGGTVLTVRTDVTKEEEVKALAQKTLDAFGKVNLLFNNAGVAPTGVSWAIPPDVYRWVYDVNIMGVVHGMTTFVPIMIEQAEESHVVNTASGAALASFVAFSLYASSKHAVLALSEGLWQDLMVKGHTHVGVTCVMPGYVKSDIANWSKTVDDPRLRDELEVVINDPVAMATATPGVVACSDEGDGMPAAVCADMVFKAIANGELYVSPNNDPNVEIDKAVAFGRITGVNNYAAILAAMAQQQPA
jgi:NADP-dependent 3-hydroxy acid dehydrogenase YdfG